MALRPAVLVTLVTVALTLVLLAVVPRPLSPDVSGQLWIAGRLREGARLYVDISEINPPLWFWMAIPVDAVADVLRVRAEGVLIAALGCAALASLLATASLLPTTSLLSTNRLPGGWSPAARATFLLYAAAVLLVMPLRDLGQREQFALIGALPYAALIAARRERQAVPGWLALLVGGGAAAGFALKHYFVGVPVLLELWLIVGLRRDWRPLRAETLVLATAAIGYGAAIMVVTPGYLRVSVPELMLAYGGAGAPDFLHMLRPAQPVWILIGCGIATVRRRVPPLAVALLVAGLGFFAAWAIQHKGWPYQSIATTGVLALAMAAALLEGAVGVDGPASAGARPRVIAVAALVLPLLLCLVPTQWVPSPASDIAPALADLSPGDTVAVISTEGRTAWASTIGRGFRFSGRRGAYWILGAVDANDRGAHDPRIAALGRRMVSETALDYRCRPPRRIVFMPAPPSNPETTASDNPLRYFLRDPGFAQVMAHYRRLDRGGNFGAFALVRPLAPPPAGACGRGG